MVGLTFSEENLHTLRHVDPQEHVGIAYDRRKDCQKCGFENGILRKVFLAESLRPQVPLDHECTIEPSEYPQDDVEYDLEEMPRTIIAYFKHD